MNIPVKSNANFNAGKPAVPFPELPPTGLKLSREELEFAAHGPLSKIFGPLFAQQDSYAPVCRMPRPPMLFADRVTGIAGEAGSMGSGIVWTETDVKANAWYLHNGRMPPGITIEAGQADLLLISWLGVDFLNRSERVYRLLGCELTFHSSYLPKVGDTIRFQIHIDAHAQVGDTKLFFFRYDARIGDQLISSVRSGQAGFFSDAELGASGGVLWSPEEDRPKADARLDPLPRVTQKRSFSTPDIEAFAQGDAVACFGEGFEMAAAHTRTPNIGKGRMRLFDRIAAFDPQGGPWGRGYMRAEADVPTDAWFYAGHFHNDPCMPGTLMAEAGAQVLEFYMAACGFTIDRDGWIFGPTTGEASKFVCRGQVIPDRAHVVTYEIFIEEIVGGDRPAIYAALLAKSDGHKVFLARRFGICLVPDWPFYERHRSPESIASKRIVSPSGDVPGDLGALLASADGKPSDAFGSLYAPYDDGRRIARLPSPPYHFMSEVVSVDCPPGVITPEGQLAIDYHVPKDAWYFQDGGNGRMPFAVLMEVVLQPGGWFATYMGFSKPGIAFRNLDGANVRLVQEVTLQTGTLRTTVTFKRYAEVGTMTIVFFTIACTAKSGTVVTLETSFGYFPPEALVQQKGLPVTQEHRMQLAAPSATRERLDATSILRRAGRASLPAGRFDLVDEITGFWVQGGKAGLGRIRGRQKIVPGAWYFKAHFFQDPVQPGSIGLEGLITLAKAAALLFKLDEGFANPRFEAPANGEPFIWKFRGQVLPTNREVTTEIEISRIVRDEQQVAIWVEGSLWCDGIRIYELKDLALRIRAGDEPRRSETAEAPAAIRQRRIDLASEPWLAGHCPTYKTPAFPIFGVVGAVLETARSNAVKPQERLIALTNLEISRWVRLDHGPVSLTFKSLRRDGDRQWLDILMANARDSKEARIGYVIETYATDYPTPPAPWPGPRVGETTLDPYEYGGLFHTDAFRRAEGLTRDRSSSAFEVDIAGALDAAHGDITILLDLVAHGIPYGEPDLWFDAVPAGSAALPRRIESCTFFAELPTTGRLRVVSKALDLPTPCTPRCGVQVQHQGRVILEYVLVKALLSPLGNGLATKDWRAFLLHDRPVPGGHLAIFSDGTTRFSLEQLKSFNWFPGSVEKLYRVSGEPMAVVEAVALKDHFARRFGIHPAYVELQGDAIRIGDKVLQLSDHVTRDWGSSSVFQVANLIQVADR